MAAENSPDVVQLVEGKAETIQQQYQGLLDRVNVSQIVLSIEVSIVKFK